MLCCMCLQGSGGGGGGGVAHQSAIVNPAIIVLYLAQDSPPLVLLYISHSGGMEVGEGLSYPRIYEKKPTR